MIQQHGCKRRVTFPLPEREEFPSLNASDASCIHFAAYYWGLTQMSKDTLNDHEHKQGKVYQKTFSSVHVVRIWREELWGLVSIAGFSISATWLRNGLCPGISTISWEAVFRYIILKHYGVFKGQQRKPAAFVLHTERLTIKHIHLAKNRFHPHTALWEITIFGNNHAQYPHKISNPPKETVTLLCPGLVYSMTPLSLSRVRTEQLLFSGSGNKRNFHPGIIHPAIFSSNIIGTD